MGLGKVYLHTLLKHLHDCIISVSGEGLAHKTSLTLPLWLKCLSQESESKARVYTWAVCVLWLSIFPLFLW